MHQLLITALYVLLVYTAFTILLTYVERIRIKAVHGKVLNVKKIYSVAAAVAAFIVTVAIFKLWQWHTAALGIACIGIRGVFYDPSLNLFLGRYIDAESENTNSKTDKTEHKRNISFWMQRLLYLLLAAAGYGLFIVSHLIFEQ